MRSPKEAQSFIAEVGYPVVAKPDNGVGAAATYKLCHADDLERFFAEKPPVDYFVEEFVSGELYSFDGLVDGAGEIVFYTSHHFNRGIMEVVNEGLDMFYYSLRELPEDLVDAGRRAVKAFDLRERFFHIEFFRQPKGLVALEVNMRPPGGLTMDMFNYANDIDLYGEWARLVTGQGGEIPYHRPYYCAYVGRKGHRSHRLTHEDILRAYADLVVHHQPIAPVLTPAIGEYAYLLRAPELAPLQAALAEIVALA